MWRFILLSFAFLGWGFYELSGGADFAPPERDATAQAMASATRKAAEPDVIPVKFPATAPRPTPQKLVLARAEQPLSAKRVSVTLAAARSPAKADKPRPAVSAATLDAIKVARLTARSDDQSFFRAASPPPATPVTFDDTAATPEPAAADLRDVTGRRVNMRNGPGTGYDVVARLTRGERVEVLQDPGNGWVKLRVVETQRIGWMADFLLTAAR